jgi:hypothetical protein
VLEPTTCAKSGGQEEKKFEEKLVQPDRLRQRLAADRPWAADSWAATSSRWAAGDQRSGPSHLATTGPRPLVATRGSAARGRPATSGRPLAAS